MVLLIAIALERLCDSRADAAYFRAATLAPEDPLIRLNMAGRHARAGRLGDAVAEAAVLAALLGDKPNAQVLLIAIALERLCDSRADAAYFRAATLAPEDPLIRLNMAGRHARAGRLGDAVAEAAVLAALLGDKPNAQVLLIAIALERLCDSRADPAYFRAATLAPEDPLIRLNMAGRHARAGRLGDAVAEAAVLAALLGDKPNAQLSSGLASLLAQLRNAGVELSRLPDNLPEADMVPASVEDLSAEEHLAADEV